MAQASRFGAEMVLAREITGFETRGPVRTVQLSGGGEVEARAVLIATGVSYRRLEATGLDELDGRGVYYGATASEASQCVGEVVVVVGAANSAGQAALNLARYAEKVVMLVRAATLLDSMSHLPRVRASRRPRTSRSASRARSRPRAATAISRCSSCADGPTGTVEELHTNWLFVFIGASPRTDWLGQAVARDDKGFIVTGPEVLATGDGAHWPLTRAPYALETSVPGVFAAGDVRLDSMKRVASAVGEGAMSVYLVHLYLETI